MSATVRVKAPEELKVLLERLNAVDRKLALGHAVGIFGPELARALVVNSGGSGQFARGWNVSLVPNGGGLNIVNSFGKARFVEFPTKRHVILPKNRGGAAVLRHKLKKLFTPGKPKLGLVKGPAPKSKKPKKQKEGARRKGIVGVLAWRKGGKGAFSAYKVNASTKAGAFIYAKEVYHPGTKGKFVFRDTIRMETARLFSLLTTELKNIFKG